MKRLLLVAVMVLVSLVGMVGFSRDAESLNDTPTMSAISNAVSALQATANPTTGTVNELLEIVYAWDTGYDLDTVYDWETAYDLKKVYAMLETGYDLDTVYDWETAYDLKKVYAMLETGYDLDTVYDWETVYDLKKVYARVPASSKMYYLTVASFTGGDAIKACDPRFHMASISEIQDPSNLQYATRSTPAYDSPAYDQGLGPPLNHRGWVRSGAYMQTEFEDSCDVSKSSSDQQSSTTMSLHSFWFNAKPFLPASAPMSRWHMAHHTCSQPEPVWCVEDPE